MITHLLAVQDLDATIWEKLILSSLNFSQAKDHSTPRLKFDQYSQLSFLFLEPSTRTHLSFAIAANKLGLQIHNLQAENSSIAKGESLIDTFLNLEAMGINAAVIRLKEENLLREVSQRLTTLRLICAGEGKTSHPSQALLDACTIYEHFNRLDNLRILFLGDVEHSRVYNSNKEWLSWYKNSLYTLSPTTGKLHSLKDHKTLDEPWENYLGDFDIIMMLRPQLERHNSPMDLHQYHHRFGLTLERFSKINSRAICMHPGPFYSNTEFSSELLHQKQFKIMRQVYWGVFARMSIFNAILGK